MRDEIGSVLETILMQSVDEEGAMVQPIARQVFQADFAASPPKRHAAINIRPYPDNQHQYTTQRLAI